MTSISFRGKNDGLQVGDNYGSLTAEFHLPPMRTETPSPQDKECLKALFLTDPEEDRAALKRKRGDRAQGTCEWILETDEIIQWLKGANDIHSNILWLYGNPGTGKSTMAITLAEEIPKQQDFVNDDRILAYFFCDSAHETRRTVTAILRGLLYQFQKQRPHFLEHFLAKFSERGESIFDSFDALWSIFTQIIDDKLTGHKYCVIDALDECDDNSQHIFLTQLDHYYRETPKEHENKLHILITSRPYPEIYEHLRFFRHKDLSQYHQRKQDIKQMISEKVQNLKQKKTYTKSIEQEVTRILLDKAEGTFLWIGIACQELSKIRSRDAVKTLQNLPRGLDSLYRELLNNAIQQNRDEEGKINEILHFVAVAQTTMTVSMLSQACRSYEDEPDEERITFFREDIEMCRLMVIIEGNFVRLLHKSVKDFLLKMECEGLTQNLKAHATLSYRCISYLIKCDLNGEAADQGFLDYAVEFWPEHAHLANTEFSILDEHRVFYENSSSQWDRWNESYEKLIWLEDSDLDTASFTIFHAAAEWDVEALARIGLEMLGNKTMGSRSVKYDDWEFQGSREGTPLRIAARRGNTKIMDMLLARADKTMEIHTGVISEAVINVASGAGILQLLSDHAGCSIEITESILELAAQNRRCGYEIFKIILSQYGDSIRPRISESVMKLAAANPMLGSKLVELIAERFPGILNTLTTLGVFESAIFNDQQNLKVVSSLLTHTSELMVPEQIVETAIRTRHSTRDITLLLFSHADRASVLTERLILTAASHSTQLCQDLIKITLEDATASQIPTELEHLIVRWCDVKLINLFLRVMDSRIAISKSMIEAARDEDVKKILEARMDTQCQSTKLSTLAAEDHTVPSFHRYFIRQIGVLKDHTDEVFSSAFSPDGSKFASGGRDKVVRVYRCMGFMSLGQLIGHEHFITCLGWSPDSKKLVSGSSDGSIRIWDTEVRHK
ncbi:WD40 repeat-like protein [Penicillium robsamsonii]|uniref:WD40 repeat-like protein n=1 Tax=Penicillium robsamsonii TaxID=1792511 RepID=UPI0025470702|nr:WD40 repeat-like protein [Penicillium robsamsonii]KAJ5817200.1 WD40 repeat-like protein [Penicillium robsamsonii]